jgi:predicted HicB family RNase H-like nuclease
MVILYFLLTIHDVVSILSIDVTTGQEQQEIPIPDSVVCGSRNPDGVMSMPETVVHFQIRMPPPLHEKMASRARDEKNSLNALVVAILAEAVERRNAVAAEGSEVRGG